MELELALIDAAARADHAAENKTGLPTGVDRGGRDWMPTCFCREETTRVNIADKTNPIP